VVQQGGESWVEGAEAPGESASEQAFAGSGGAPALAFDERRHVIVMRMEIFQCL
jgi:hypothetical protein